MSEQPRARETFKSPEPVLSPRSVAIVGATDRPSWPKQIYGILKAAAFPGDVYPVNPRLSSVWGVRCYPDLGSLPNAPDHAIVVVPAPAVQDVLERGVAAGLKSATIYSGNIGEGSDPAIVARGEALRELVRRSGLIVNGPNCMGGNSFHTRFFGYPNQELLDIAPGSVACISQSGGTLQFIVQSAAARGVRFSVMFSTGNEIDLDLADYVDYLVDDPRTRVIALFIEGVRRPTMFMQAAARALAAGKAILAIKTGKSEKSRVAAQSHTGAVAGDYAVFRAMCERYGIVLCDTLDDLVEAMLVFQAGRTARGNRVGWVTTSGGTVDLLYDYIEEIGTIVAPEFSQATKEAIRAIVPAELALKNPLDAGIPSTDENAAAMCIAVANDPQVDMLAWAATLPRAKRLPDAAVLARIAASTDKPVVAFSRMNYMVAGEALSFQDALGMPFLQALTPTVRVLGALAFHGARVGRTVARLPEAEDFAKGSAEDLDEDRLPQTLAGFGLRSPRQSLARSPEEAARCATLVGYPVALKIVSKQLSHKSDVGGVRLGLASEDAVRREAEALLSETRRRAPSATLDGLLVQEMARGVEVIVGVRRDPLYGPFLMVGAGGVFVELLQDVALRLLPVTEADVRAMLEELKLGKLLAGWRGAPASDIDALVRSIRGFADFFLAHRHRLSDVEINPLMVAAAGEGAVAVDVRLTRL